MNHYPALFELANQKLHPLGGSESFLVGRNETADVPVLDTTCSRHHFRIVRREGRHFVEPLNAGNPTYHNGRPVANPEPVEHGSVLQAGRARFQFLVRERGDDTRKNVTIPLVVPAADSTVMAGSGPVDADLPGLAVFPLAGVMMVGRESGRVQILLPHPQVSRSHACITLQGKTATLTDLNSANGTFVNGQRIQARRDPQTRRSDRYRTLCSCVHRNDLGPASSLR